MESSVREDCLYKEWVFSLTVALVVRISRELDF